METKNLLKILIPVLIVVVIAVMFIVKNSNDSDEPSQTPTSDVSGESTPTDAQFPLKITSVDLEEIKTYGVPTVIDFGSDSCIPCKEMAPVLEKLNAEMQGKAAIQFMDVWVYTEGVEAFPVQVIPTQFFFNADGTPYAPSGAIISQIGGFQLYSDKEGGEHIFTAHVGGLTEDQLRTILQEMGVQ